MQMRYLAQLLPAVLLMGAQTLFAATALTTQQQKTLDYLTENWGVNMNVSGIDLAMDAVAGDCSDEDRYTLGAYIRDHPEVHEVRRRFGWETIALSPAEKRIAVLLSRAEREGRPAPNIESLTRSLGLPRNQIAAGLNMLKRFEIIRPAAEAGRGAYRMSKPRYVNWEGGMKITFTSHRAEVKGVGLLDTYWALDFIALVNAKWKDKQVTVEDHSQLSAKPIRIVFENGEVTQAEPPDPWVFRGGGWGVNNLFRSEEELNTWLDIHPELKGRQTLRLQDFLNKVAAGELE